MNIQKMTFAVLALGGSAAVSAAAGMAHTTAQLPDASVLPQDVIQVSPLVPRMGEHWANPQTLPLGPIYCVHEGKIVCFEFMISQADFEAGKSWPALTGIKNMPPVDHIDVGFQPHGHEGFEEPHYDIHLFFITPDEVSKIQ